MQGEWGTFYPKEFEGWFRPWQKDRGDQGQDKKNLVKCKTLKEDRARIEISNTEIYIRKSG